MRSSLLSLLEQQSSEPILDPRNRQLAFKITDIELWDLYNRHLECFWQPAEIEPSKDKGWESLTDEERNFISMVLAFFATADSLVYDNLDMNFSSEVQITEAKFFYGIQSFMENIHSQVYMSLLSSYVTCEHERNKLINAIDEVPTIRDKANWAQKYFSREIPFAMRLIAFAIVEGIYFSSAFASIFWLKKYRKGILDALTLSNAFIARDEGLHTEFAVALFKRLQNTPLETDVHNCFQEAVDLELNFIKNILHVSLIGMDHTSLSDYVKFVANRLLTQLGYNTIFSVKTNPLTFMETQSLRVNTNFFESKVHEYTLATPGHYREDEDF